MPLTDEEKKANVCAAELIATCELIDKDKSKVQILFNSNITPEKKVELLANMFKTIKDILLDDKHY